MHGWKFSDGTVLWIDSCLMEMCLTVFHTHRETTYTQKPIIYHYSSISSLFSSISLWVRCLIQRTYLRCKAICSPTLESCQSSSGKLRKDLGVMGWLVSCSHHSVIWPPCWQVGSRILFRQQFCFPFFFISLYCYCLVLLFSPSPRRLTGLCNSFSWWDFLFFLPNKTGHDNLIHFQQTCCNICNIQ